MSKIQTEFKLKDLYAIKHALETNIINKDNRLNLINSALNNQIEFDEELMNNINLNKIKAQVEKDITHEKQIVDYIVSVIRKYKTIEEHYSK